MLTLPSIALILLLPTDGFGEGENVPTEIFHAPLFEDVFDIRIHEGAEKGSRLTMSSELQKATEPLGHCFGQLETDADWIEWRPSRSAFYTSSQMPLSVTKNSNNIVGTLHLLCAGNQMHSFPFRVHITHRNHHPPQFSQQFFKFHVPLNYPIGSVIAKLEVIDQDPVIYNSERRLSFTKDEEYIEISQEGYLKLKKSIIHLIPYTPFRTQILAIDYGSPQLFTIANLTIIPVTISGVRDSHVNIATNNYQIFEWETPEFGKVNKYRLSIRRDEQVIYEEELEPTKTMALTKIKIDGSMNMSYQISAIDENGETSTDWSFIGSIDSDIECKGECARGGVPLCFFGSFNRVEQFIDSRGSHCLCFPGFIGTSCGIIDKCNSERTIDSWGGIDWKEVNSNTTLRLPCPYNHPTENQSIERRCSWNEEAGRAVWEKPKERDRCTTQISIITHLSLMDNYGVKAATISAVNTVTTFIRRLLMIPAFSRETNKYAHFDQKIAEIASHVLDSVVNSDLDRVEGNSTIMRDELWKVLNSFSKSLPIPYSLSSTRGGIHMKTIEWVKNTDFNDNLVGQLCRIQLPTIDETRVLHVTCLKNSSIFEVLDPKSPVLSIQPSSREDLAFTRMTIFLRFPDKNDNYTCVYFDEEEKAWSTKGIRRIDQNYNGFVKCETNHYGAFALLPDRLFYNSETFWKDLASHLPTVTSFVTLICTILLLFMAAVQKNQPIDCAFLLYLFFIFMIHLAHLLLFLAPQVGEPFTFSTTLHFILQFCIISSSGLISLVLFSIHSTIISYDASKDDEVTTCFSRPCPVFTLGLFVPSLFTFSTYYFLDGRDLEVSRLFERIDWLFISNYLIPTALFFSISIVYSVWNVYIGSGTKNNRRRCSSDRLLSLGPAISASVTSLFMIFFLCSTLLLFFFREQSSIVIFLFCLFQFFHVVSAFFFASYLFRLRFLLQRGFESTDSTDSLERKRDISRALLDHVETKSDIASDRCIVDGGFTDAGFVPGGSQSSPNYRYTPPQSSHEYIVAGSITDNNHRYNLHHNIFERAPMVSIV